MPSGTQKRFSDVSAHSAQSARSARSARSAQSAQSSAEGRSPGRSPGRGDNNSPGRRINSPARSTLGRGLRGGVVSVAGKSGSSGGSTSSSPGRSQQQQMSASSRCQQRSDNRLENEDLLNENMLMDDADDADDADLLMDRANDADLLGGEGDLLGGLASGEDVLEERDDLHLQDERGAARATGAAAGSRDVAGRSVAGRSARGNIKGAREAAREDRLREEARDSREKNVSFQTPKQSTRMTSTVRS